MPRGGGMSSRGRGKFKISRGGGRHFSRDLDPRIAERNRLNNPEDESSEEEDEESSDDDDGRTVPIRPDASTATLPKEMAGMNLKLGNTEPVQEEETSRADRKAMKKAQAAKEAIQEDNEDEEDGEDDDDLLNPQQATETRQGEKAKAKTAPQTAVPELSRKEREAADKKAAADRYAKLHAQGKTQEAKSDLARLQEVRRKREAAAAQRQAEADEVAKQAAAKKEKAAGRKGQI